MTKEEILEFIKVNGKYNKESKKKLNKLIKKYHPDKNKDDKKTIYILYEVKKEFEKGNLKEETKVTNKKENINIPILNKIIEALEERKDFIQKELNKLYKKSDYYYNKIYEESYNIGLVDLKIEESNNNLINLKKIDVIDFLILFMIILVVIFSLLLKNNLLLIFILFPILFEVYYINIRYELIINNKLILNKLLIEKESLEKNNKEYNDNIKSIKQEEIVLEKEIRTINNDIAFYNHEKSKYNNKTYSKENNNEKVMTRK